MRLKPHNNTRITFTLKSIHAPSPPRVHKRPLAFPEQNSEVNRVEANRNKALAISKRNSKVLELRAALNKFKAERARNQLSSSSGSNSRSDSGTNWVITTPSEQEKLRNQTQKIIDENWFLYVKHHQYLKIS